MFLVTIFGVLAIIFAVILKRYTIALRSDSFNYNNKEFSQRESITIVIAGSVLALIVGVIVTLFLRYAALQITTYQFVVCFIIFVVLPFTIFIIDFDIIKDIFRRKIK